MRLQIKKSRFVMRVVSGPHQHLILPSLVLLALLIVTLWEMSLQRGHRESPSSSRNRYMKDPFQLDKRAHKRRMIYVITPTYPRVNQIPEMTRLAQTLMLVPDVHWIVAEDTVEENVQLVEYLISTGLPYTYLKSPMPRQMNRWKMPPVGVSGRRAGLAWVRANVQTGVVYFADDDNTYDYRIFEEIRSTQAVSMFPAGFVTRLQLSTPILKNGKFAGWYDGWIADRKYPVDMATFAFSVELLHKRPRANMAWTYSYQEESILASLGVKPEDIEFKAEGCTKIWVWHTKAQKPERADRDILRPLYDGTNLRVLQEQMFIKSLRQEENEMNWRSLTTSFMLADDDNVTGVGDEDSRMDLSSEFAPEYEN
ncbi:galactosylgalactosylxylosylprotein 3-beta-glucuronosyltransferase S-like [Macrobrachium rosenbergii]|uniref:galactosylgalactosylxylosylprotein 3-beta-glucuronosyltransferase S-like n=1 Tax=Macrobrachium rosenbergii TaxID=79674 RepID=UPI0034D4A735